VALIRRSLVRMAFAGTLPLLAVGVSAASARAATSEPGHASIRSGHFSYSIVVTKNTSFGGYLTQRSRIKSVLATLEVPFIKKCATTEDSGMGPVVIVGGSTYFVGAGAEASCELGATTYQIAVNYNGSENKFLTVKPKDQVIVYIAVTSKSTTVVINDLTSKKKISRQVPAGVLTYAELGDDTLVNGGTNKQLPIPAFTNHRFTDCKVNGQDFSMATPLTDQELVKGKTVLIQAGPLTTKGTAFTMLFKNAG
jgi:hypothetical protein